jgi:hypothetical protein
MERLFSFGVRVLSRFVDFELIQQWRSPKERTRQNETKRAGRTRMNARQEFLAPPTTALRRLAEFLRESGSSLKPTEVAAQAINQWIATAKGQYPSLAATPTRGYQWKTLFLPEGSELRMRYRGHCYHARVEGDAIVYGGRCVSPRQMAIAIAGDGHNAWREFSILLPGEISWKPASLLRRESEQQPPVKTVSPEEAMTAAAACMTETLKTALALVERIATQAVPQCERRVERHRRAQDLMADACQLD